ncbi:MAG: hypothetical protein ACI8S6_004210 [Myxococcota bacterium]|jgi:hypothetical protein
MRLIVAIVLSGLGCAVRPPKDLGALPIDQASLTETEVLAHLGAALSEEARGEIGQLDVLLRSDAAVFGAAPDPSGLFEARRAAHAALPPLAEGAAELRVLTFNTALLDRTYLGNLVQMPEIELRRPVMGERLMRLGYDILLLQEVWEWSDVEALKAAGEAAGYIVYGGSPDKHPEHGLAIAVRADLIAPDKPQDRREQQFSAQRKLEYFPGPDVRRGWLTWSFTLAGTEQQIHLYDVHATSFVSFWLQRELQAREVGAEISTRPEGDVVVLGGDLNSGPYYRDDVWIDGENVAVGGWWRNAVAYALWLHYGEMYDALNAVELPQDVALGETIPQPRDHRVFLIEPYGRARWCGEVSGVVFTATDCNDLYFQSYAGTEFPARLDHLMIRDPSGAVRVMEAGLVLDQPAFFGGREVELSDHYGIDARIQIGSEAPPVEEEEN